MTVFIEHAYIATIKRIRIPPSKLDISLHAIR